MKTLLLFAVVVLAALAECQAQSAAKCKPNEFYKPFDDSCMACDPFCASPCEDKIGCTKCVSGYYTSREDPEWPNACKKCTIPNCLECRSDIYDAWPMQCIQCVAGYIQADNRRRCDPIPSGSVASGILHKPVPEPVPQPLPQPLPQPVAPEVPVARPAAPVYVPPRPTTGPQYVPPRPVPVPAGSIVYPKPVACHVYGGPGPVTTLPPGYVIPQPRPEGIPAVRPTYVPQPRPEGRPVVPPTYVPQPRPEGRPVVPPTYVPSIPTVEPKPLPRPAVEPTPVPRPVPEPVPVPRPTVEPVPLPQPAKPQPEVSPETLTPGTCPVGSFVKKMDGSCMECDVNCLPGQCGDNFGCAKCADGYFTRAGDPEWPFVCVLCDLPNCVRCIDNAFDAWPTLCAECAPGYELSTSRKCVPASA